MKKKIIISLVLIWLVTLILFIITTSGTSKLLIRAIAIIPYIILFFVLPILIIRDLLKQKNKKNHKKEICRDIIFTLLILAINAFLIFEVSCVIIDYANGPKEIIGNNLRIKEKRTAIKYKRTKYILTFLTNDNVIKQIEIKSKNLKEEIEKMIKGNCKIKIYYFEKLNEVYNIEKICL